MFFDALLVNMPHELLNEAKWHLNEAERYAKSVFELEREVRATAFYAIAAVESFMNKVAHEHVLKNPGLDQRVKDYLMEKYSQIEKGELKEKERLLSLDEKFDGWTKIITGKVFDKSDAVWGDFKKVKDFRDNFVHYKPTTTPSVYDEAKIEMARKAVKSAQEVIQRFYTCWNELVPPWVTEPYRRIK